MELLNRPFFFLSISEVAQVAIVHKKYLAKFGNIQKKYESQKIIILNQPFREGKKKKLGHHFWC